MIGTRLRALLEQKKISGKDFAKRIGVSEPKVSRWLGNKTGFTLEELIMIADELGVSLDFLLGRDAFSVEDDWKTIPIVESVSRGDPRDDKSLHRSEIVMSKGESKFFDFGFMVQDGFMEDAGILFLDIVFIKYDCPAEDGVIFLLELDGKAVLARVFLEDGRIILKKEFNGARPVSIDSNSRKRFRLIGKVTGLFRPDMHIYEDPEQG